MTPADVGARVQQEGCGEEKKKLSSGMKQGACGLSDGR